MERGGADSLAEGLVALRYGRWADAVGLIERALDDVAEEPSLRADALDAIADARWWLGEPEGAAAAREQAYALDGRPVINPARCAQLVMDEKVAIERFMYAASVVHCLPVGMSEHPSAGTGTVLRTSTLKHYARRPACP